MKLFNIKNIFFLFFVFLGSFLQADVVGSESLVSVEAQAFFPATPLVPNQINAFAWMKSGFVLEDYLTSCTFQSVFPVGGVINLNGGTIYLNTDLCLNEQIVLKNIGTISSGQAQTVDLPPTMTYFANSSFPATLDKISFNLHHDLTLEGTVFINRDVTINGNNHVFDLGEGFLLVKEGSSLTLNNISLVGIGASNIACEHATSRISMKDVIWYQDANTFTFTQGSIDFKNYVSLIGTATFVYASPMTSTITKNSTLKIGDGLHFHLGKASEDGLQPLYFEDPNSCLYFDNSYFHVTQYGANLSRGVLFINGALDIDIAGTTAAHALSMGDVTQEGDLAVQFLPGSHTTFLNGYAIANFYNPGCFIAQSATTKITRNPANTLALMNDLQLENLSIEAKPGSTLVLIPGKNLYYKNVTVYLDKTTFEATGRRYNVYTNLLNGNDEVFLSKGALPAYTRVSNTNNYLRGQGAVDGLVYLTDTGASLICDFDGKINKSIQLNGGTVQLARNLNSAYDASIVGTGTLDLSNNTWFLGSKDSTWNRDLFIKGSLGTIQFNANVLIDATITCSGTITLDGQYHQLTFGPNGYLVVQPYSTLTLHNFTIADVNNYRIRCFDSTAKVIFEKTTVLLDDVFTCTVGQFKIQELAEFTGTATFVYQSDIPMQINSASTLLINGIGFEVNKQGLSGAEPLNFEDKTGVLHLKNGSMKTGQYGMNFLKGTLFCENDVNFSFYSTNSIDALVMGDLTDANDAVLSFVPGASIAYNPGVMIFNLYDAHGFVSRSSITKVLRKQNSVFYYNNNIVLPYLTITSQANANNIVATGKSLDFQNCVIIGDGYEFDITGKRFNQFTNTLNGNKEISLTKGILPANTRVEGSGNIIRGTGDISGKITLVDQNATLTLALNGSLYQSTPLNNGTLVISRDVTMAYNSVVTGSGTLDLQKSTLMFGLQESSWTGTVTIKSTESSLALRNKMLLSGKMTVSGNLTIDGNSNILEFMPTGSFIVQPSSSVRFKNMLLKNLALTNLYATDTSSVIIFENSAGILSNDYSFTTGAMIIEDEVIFSGEYTFTLVPPVPTKIKSYAKIIFQNDIRLATGRYGSVLGSEPLYFENDTAGFMIKEGYLQVLPTGMTLTRCNWFINDNVNIDVLSTGTTDGLQLGDGTSIHDVFITFMPGSRVDFRSGDVVYHGSTPYQIHSFSKNSSLKMGDDAHFHIAKDCVLKTLYLESSPFATITTETNVYLKYDNCLLESAGEQFNITGKNNQSQGLLLSGDDTIIIVRGTFGSPTSVSGIGNKIIGTGNIARSITLLDAAATLTLQVQGSVLSDIHLHDSILYLDNDLILGNEGCLHGTGTLALQNNIVSLGQHELVLTHTLQLIGSENSEIILNNNYTLCGSWHLEGNIIIDGARHYALKLAHDGAITIAPGSLVTFKNITLDAISSAYFVSLDQTSTIVFDNSTLFMSDDFSCSAAHIIINNDTMVSGGHAILFETQNGVSINAQSSLQILDDAVCSFVATNNNKPLLFNHTTAQYVLSNASLLLQGQVFSLTGGKFIIKGNSKICGQVVGDALVFGDETADHDQVWIMKPGASVTFNAADLQYKNLENASLLFDASSQLFFESGTACMLYQTLSSLQGTCVFNGGAALKRIESVSLSMPITMRGEISYELL
jgi:hypothetical protein